MDEFTSTAIAAAAVIIVAIIFVNAFSAKDPVLPNIDIPLEKYEAEDCIDAPVKEKMDLVLTDRPGKLQCYDPATMQHLGEVELMNRERVNQIVASARVAQKDWAKSSFGERRAVLRAINDYYLNHVDDICRVAVRDTGKTKLGAVLGEITPTCEKIRWVLNSGEDLLRTETRGGQGMMTVHKSAFVEYEPLGVLGVLAPFNYVGHNLLNHIISGLFTGNAVVCKVSEYTSWSADFLVRPVHAALKAAGYSPDLVQVVTGMAEAGSALVESGVDKVIFTGSDRVGKLVMKAASEKLTPVVLELGGKDPFIVCEDVDLEWLLPTALRGVFQNAGQNCIGVERIFIHESIHDKFVEMAKAKVLQMRQGVPLKAASIGETVDIGAMTMPGSLEHIQSLVDDAVARGAKLVCGGKINESLKPGLFFEPTIITGVTSEMRIAQEEVFGPVMAIRAWSNEEDLLDEVNDCPYALGSSVFSADVSRAKRIAKGVRAGMVNINDFGINYLCQSLPFGGRACSGFNKFAGPEGLRACCNVKAVTADRIPGVKTTLPEPFIYPTANTSHETAAHLVGMAYDPSWTNKVMSTISLVKGLVFPQKQKTA
mmetsp:Transcript_25181/g.54399  ORF Transcript_25181/g.54399 Transcript_25181/m.54399 type:complete len:597 (+) Transcript_25181:63-1853(+)